MFSTNCNNIEIKNEEHYSAYGVCRCCLAEGLHRDVTKEYYYENIKEVYKDIFLKCFNFSMSLHVGITTLICDDCVQCLRDANTFRMNIAATEVQLLSTFVFKRDPEFVHVPEPHTFAVEVKKEIESEHPDAEDPYVKKETYPILRSVLSTPCKDYHLQMADKNDDDDDWTQDELVIDDDVEYVDDDDVYCSSVSRITTSGKDDEPSKIVEGVMNQLPRFLSPVQPGRKQTGQEVCSQVSDNQSSTTNNTVKPNQLELFLNIPGLETDTIMTTRQVLARNATTIFEWSNAFAFKPKVKNGYPCFYCRELCKPDTFREHQGTHDKSTLYNRLRRYTNADKFVIYADITDLKCTICEKKIRSLIDLREHLTAQHSKKIYASADRVIPFKLKESEFECQVCGQMFETFGMVERHMNAHYGSFVCEICGDRFITKKGLALHNHTAHQDENIICELCKKKFRTRKKYRTHHELVHLQLRKYACLKCPEKFLDYFARRRHMVKMHDEVPILHKCNFCEKSFDRKFSVTCHEARCQMKPMFFKCDLCSYTCLNRIQFKDHLINHVDGRPNHQFQCPICKKLYVSNRTLMTHLQKYHKQFE